MGGEEAGLPRREVHAPAEGRRRVLFVAEAVSLAHVGRLVTLALRLDRRRHEIVLACDPRYRSVLGPLPFPVVPLASIRPEDFAHAVRRGTPVYDCATLSRYVADDLRVVHEVTPDAIIGDFRLSLSVSARIAKIPYVALTNAHWSPHAAIHAPVPELPMTRVLGPRLAQPLFDLFSPLMSRIHAAPLNRVRKRYGLPSLGGDTRRTYTDGDMTLYADLPSVVRTPELPLTHRFVGPVHWSPPIPLPQWWDDLPDDRPIIYVNFGSSGPVSLLPPVLEALADAPLTVVAATAGRPVAGRFPRNAWVADFLPGSKVASAAQLLICSGGSPMTQQALEAGIPVLGVPDNLDQYLHMDALAATGAGLMLRSGRFSPQALRDAVSSLLNEPTFCEAAARLKQEGDALLRAKVFETTLDQLLNIGDYQRAPADVSGF